MADTPAKRSRTEGGNNDVKPYIIHPVRERVSRKYGIEEVTYKAKFNNDLQGEQLIGMQDELHSMFTDIMEMVKDKHPNKEDKARVTINHSGLEREVFIHCQPQHNITANVIMDRINAVLQSNKSLNVDDTFEVNIGIMSADDQGGGCSRTIVDTDPLSPNCTIRKKRSMVFIPVVRNEHLCAARAIVTCKAKLDNMPAATFAKLIRKDRVLSKDYESQRSCAIRLHRQANVPTNRPVKVNELHKFETALDIQIVVISGDTGNEVNYKGLISRPRKIFLYLKDEHYHSITGIKGFYVNRKICVHCFEVYSKNHKHGCNDVCSTCCSEYCMFDNNSLDCSDCNMTCRNAVCYQRHKEQRQYSTGTLKGTDQPSLCTQYFRCKTCFIILDTLKRAKHLHTCGEWLCTCCHEYVLGDHLCYYRIKKPKMSSGRFLYYDFETCQNTIITCDLGYKNKPRSGCDKCTLTYLCTLCRKCINCKRSYCGLQRHVPNFLVCQTVCDVCKDHEFTPQSKCANCGDRCSACSVKDNVTKNVARELCQRDTCSMRENIFKGPNTTENFCKWLLTPQHKDVTVIAHNAKAFDAHFILGYCVDNGIFPEIIFTGTKIMLMSINQGVSIRFIDSLNFLPMRLKSLPKALGLRGELKKGEFPHLANTLDNQTYVGPMFAPYYYGVDFMSTADRTDFFTWYNEQNGKTFNFQQEMLDYTRSDVTILREACTNFRALIQTVTTIPNSSVPGIDPFAHATLASCAMQVIRQLMLYEVYNVTLIDGRSGEAVLRRNTWYFDGSIINHDFIATSTFIKSPIPQIPAQGYGKHHNASQKSSLWLEWISHSECRLIQHARNGGEFRIPGTRYFVDGIHIESNTVYEYLGCRFHGHICLQDRHIRDPRTRMTLKALYDRTLERLAEIRNLGYKVISIWECHYDKELQTNSLMRQFVNTCDTVKPLQIRDSFAGGRVEPTTLYYDVQDGERIRYYDVTSLYPYITMSGVFPTCHATVLKDPATFDYTLQSYYGLAQVRILPPRGLYIPVLPVRCKGKLKFPLCGTCSSRETQAVCTCNDTKRALFGTWTTPELKEAIKQGYILLKIYEVYHFPTTTQDDVFGSIFTDYVKMFLKQKQQASGYPQWVTTDADKDRYIEYYNREQGIMLDKDSIAYNPSLRTICKLFLNSVWGKFVQRQNLPKSIYMKSVTEYTQMKNDPTKCIMNFHLISDDYVVVDVTNAETFEEESTFTNEVIGIFTTSLARLHLLQVLNKTGRNTLYYDTDSVIFVERNGETVVETGDLLGDLTDELQTGTYIKTFLSTGPKSYSYKLNTDVTVRKIKGITFNYTNDAIIDFECMKQIVFGQVTSVRLPQSNQISRVKHRGIVYNKSVSKVFRKVFDKRVIGRDTYNTLPYGY